MIPLFDTLDLRSSDAVISVFRDGAHACRRAACRRGAIDVIELPADASAPLILSGDLHDNPLHLARLIRAAALDRDPATAGAGDPRPLSHLTLHELIHGDRLTNGRDFSYRVLARVAALKAAFPEHLHILLANHELAQVLGSGIVKDGVRVVEVFNEALDLTFADDAPAVLAAIRDFILALPLALRIRGPFSQPDILCAHSLPGPEMMDLFDPTVLERDLTDDDYTPRRGSAHLMVWGRGHTPEQLSALAQRWGVGLFVLGHEKADTGWSVLPPNAVILNSDHDRGVYLALDPAAARTPGGVVDSVRSLQGP